MNGISLRDYFAGLAMQILLKKQDLSNLSFEDMAWIAELAYDMAHTMTLEKDKLR